MNRCLRIVIPAALPYCRTTNLMSCPETMRWHFLLTYDGYFQFMKNWKWWSLYDISLTLQMKCRYKRECETTWKEVSVLFCKVSQFRIS